MTARRAAWLAFWLVIGLAIACLLLTSCGYPYRKAQAQFGRAAATFPELPAGYCARVYPPKDSLIKGDTVTTYDTLWGEGHTDTLYSFHRDTVRLIIYKPGQTIVQTVRVTDTLRVVNTAAVDACRIDNTRLVRLQAEDRLTADKWRAIARKRFWIILGLGAGIVLGIFLIVRKKAANFIR